MYRDRPICRRNRSYDPEMFDHGIITSDHAYLLGLVVADGWIVTDGGRTKGFAISLSERDIDCLDRIHERFGGNRYVVSAGNNRSIVWPCTHLGRLLEALGIPPRKTVVGVDVEKLMSAVDEYITDFWRGFCDGDGYLGFTEGKVAKMTFPRIGATGADEGLISSFGQFLGCKPYPRNRSGDLPSIIRGRQVPHKSTTFTVRVSGLKAVNAMNQIYYPGCCLRMGRKYIKARHIVENFMYFRGRPRCSLFSPS